MFVGRQIKGKQLKLNGSVIEMGKDEPDNEITTRGKKNQRKLYGWQGKM